jgi:uncharacterized protein (TIGR02117 family)
VGGESVAGGPRPREAAAGARSKGRRLLRSALRLFLGLLALLGLYGASALLLPRIPLNRSWRNPPAGIPVFVESNGVHTDFVVPVRSATIDWTRHLPFRWFEAVDETFEYLSFGWGDRGFYLETPGWEDLRFGIAFKAVFFLGSSALHVTYERWPPMARDDCRELRLTQDQYRRLCDFLLASFTRDAEGRFEPIDHPGYTPRDRFFVAKGTYSLFHTCNGWTGAGLDAIGVRTGVWTPFARDVMRQLADE